MKIIPALDFFDGQIVRLRQGEFSKKNVYSKTPSEVIKPLKEVGCDHFHFVDLSGAQKGKPVHTKLFLDLKKEFDISIEAGGGIRTLLQASEYINHGLDLNDRIMIGSLPFKNLKEFNQIYSEFSHFLLISVDVWGHEVKISGWQETANINIFIFIQNMLELGLREFLVTQIQKDGMLEGPDIELYHQLMKKFPEIKLIASGGISCIDDILELSTINNLYGVVLGKAWYENKISLGDLKKNLSKI